MWTFAKIPLLRTIPPRVFLMKLLLEILRSGDSDSVCSFSTIQIKNNNNNNNNWAALNYTRIVTLIFLGFPW